MKERLPLTEIIEKLKTGEWQMEPVYGKNGNIIYVTLRPATAATKSAKAQSIDPRRVKPL